MIANFQVLRWVGLRLVDWVLKWARVIQRVGVGGLLELGFLGFVVEEFGDGEVEGELGEGGGE
jgi:hypothetical protein